ncbi:hypothetical protein BC938DRAFT_476157 [Jimgerdemannia flammicorona]|uniref:Uncharacterized protein n=1 Tax=Jimgerdemannia flammicorona TaxID=994334 RepID=A0A433PJR4_9FUNG|nr:hypothetical protein BC938DRAFT_476157 [Jimgerdemannia flammicorona]
MHQVDAQFLVDQIDGFVLPDSCRHPATSKNFLITKPVTVSSIHARIHCVVEVLPEPSPRKPGKHH